MAVYIANFGEANYEWPECLKRATIATMNELRGFELWKLGDREAYIKTRMNELTAAGRVPTTAVAARWYNLMTIINESIGDIWIHRDGPNIWWTRTTDQPSEFVRRLEPVGRKREVVVCHKPCEPWRKEAENGASLFWGALHPKAKDFLATEATLQRLQPDNAAYAMALLRGLALSEWHELPSWRARAESSKNKHSGVKVFGGMEKSIWRMADTTFNTVANSNGQQVQRTVKNKECHFETKIELEQYLKALLEMQEHQCAITGLPFNYERPDEDLELRPSLDRIDSSGHYSEGNLQVVCMFINRWKGASDDKNFRRLVSLLSG